MSYFPKTPSFKSLTNLPTRVKIVDVGANPLMGDVPPYARMLSAGDADIVGFEPNSIALERLNAKKGPNETYLPCAVGDGERHVLNFCLAPGMTSLLKPNHAVLGRFHGFSDWARVMEEHPIDTRRLDDIEETEGAHYLKIDIQGAELMVFQNAVERLKDIVVIDTEVEFLPMYVGQPLFADVDLFLRRHGFVLHRFLPLVSRIISPLLVNQNIFGGMSQLLYADAIFVKDFTKPELLSDNQLLSMACILHNCYSSLDLVLSLLIEYDKRCGTEVSNAYFSGVQMSEPVIFRP